MFQRVYTDDRSIDQAMAVLKALPAKLPAEYAASHDFVDLPPEPARVPCL